MRIMIWIFSNNPNLFLCPRRNRDYSWLVFTLIASMHLQAPCWVVKSIAGTGLSWTLSRLIVCFDFVGKYRDTNVSVAVLFEVSKKREKTTKDKRVILFSVLRWWVCVEDGVNSIRRRYVLTVSAFFRTSWTHPLNIPYVFGARYKKVSDFGPLSPTENYKKTLSNNKRSSFLIATVTIGATLLCSWKLKLLGNAPWMESCTVLCLNIMRAQWYCFSRVLTLSNNRKMWESSCSPLFEDQGHFSSWNIHTLDMMSYLSVSMTIYCKIALRNNRFCVGTLREPIRLILNFNYGKAIPCPFAFPQLHGVQNRKQASEYCIPNFRL